MARHGPKEDKFVKFLVSIYQICEPCGEGEKTTYNIDVREDMTPRDVMNKVLKTIDENCEQQFPGFFLYS